MPRIWLKQPLSRIRVVLPLRNAVAALSTGASMRSHGLFAISVAVLVIGLAASATPAADNDKRNVNGTIWVANRAGCSIQGWNASTGELVDTIAMRTGS